MQREKNMAWIGSQLSDKSTELLKKYSLEFLVDSLSGIKNIDSLLSSSYGGIILKEAGSDYLKSHAEKMIGTRVKDAFDMLGQIHGKFQAILPQTKSEYQDPILACAEAFRQTMEKYRIRYVESFRYAEAVAGNYLDCDESAYLFKDLARYAGLESNAVYASKKHVLVEVESSFLEPIYIETTGLLFRGDEPKFALDDLVLRRAKFIERYRNYKEPYTVDSIFSDIFNTDLAFSKDTKLRSRLEFLENNAIKLDYDYLFQELSDSAPQVKNGKIRAATAKFIIWLSNDTISVSKKAEIFMGAMRAKTFANRKNSKDLRDGWNLLEKALVEQLRFISCIEEHLSAKEKIALFEQAAKVVTGKDASSAIKNFKKQQLDYIKNHPEEK